MKIFLDTAIRADIHRLAAMGVVDGVTTNPSLLKIAKAPYREVIADICEMVAGPVSAEVVAEDWQGMVREGRELSSIAKNVVVKIPMGFEGIRAVAELKKERIATNVTLVFSSNQAILAAKAGARFVSPFIGRLDDVGHDGMEVVEEILAAYEAYGYETEVLVASIRHPQHVVRAALLGAHVVTLPTRVLEAMFQHPLTDIGIRKFLEAWKQVPKS
ncbi:MAG: fructose-6-phosphate aldolase [Candidatus Eisenbacteria sp.]|nr:fructose-6-phosphate aldolase [Candidatus Eisenbacteria bacterium]